MASCDRKEQSLRPLSPIHSFFISISLPFWPWATIIPWIELHGTTNPSQQILLPSIPSFTALLGLPFMIRNRVAGFLNRQWFFWASIAHFILTIKILISLTQQLMKFPWGKHMGIVREALHHPLSRGSSRSQLSRCVWGFYTVYTCKKLEAGSWYWWIPTVTVSIHLCCPLSGLWIGEWEQPSRCRWGVVKMDAVNEHTGFMHGTGHVSLQKKAEPCFFARMTE